MAGVKGMKGGGGFRAGSGRKMEGEAKKVQITITITQQQREELNVLRERGVNINTAIGKEIHRLCVAYELSDDGIV